MTEEAKRIVRMLRFLADGHFKEASAHEHNSTGRAIAVSACAALQSAANWIEADKHNTHAHVFADAKVSP